MTTDRAGVATPAVRTVPSPAGPSRVGQTVTESGSISAETSGAASSAVPGSVSVAARALSDTYVFNWANATFRADLLFVMPVALCLLAGLLIGIPAAGMIAAGGAMTTGFGSKQRIDDSRLLPMLWCALGIGPATFIGMVAGHEGIGLVLIAAAAGFGFGMLSARPPGYGWVAQQCVVMLLVASAFPFSVRDAAARSALVFVGGAVQVLASTVILRPAHGLRQILGSFGRYLREERRAARETYAAALRKVCGGSLAGSPLPYAVRLGVVLGISTEIYRSMQVASGYWVPMTALLVLRPAVTDTASRAISRTVGTLAGAILASLFLVYAHPAALFLALYTVIFAWLSYSTINVNYGLFSVFLTGYIVMLLSLDNLPGTQTARHRAVATVLGGLIALTVRLTVIHHRERTARQSAPAFPPGSASEPPATSISPSAR